MGHLQPPRQRPGGVATSTTLLRPIGVGNAPDASVHVYDERPGALRLRERCADVRVRKVWAVRRADASAQNLASASTTRGLAGRRSTVWGFGGGAVIGVLGGMIGLGGAEFRLPLLVGLFGFVALQAVILNKALSLVVVVAALPARLLGVPYSEVADHWSVVLNLLTGSLVGAWLGASWATRMRSRTLYRVLALLLVLIAITLVATHFGNLQPSGVTGAWQVIAGVAAGFVIGVVAALMGVAGGELLIPTIVLLYAIDIKVAGSLALTVSLPTMLVAFARYSRDQAFQVLAANKGFVMAMAAGSVLGTIVGALLLGVVSAAVLIPLLAAVLVLSSIKMWRHA